MGQNLASTHFDAAQWNAVDQQIAGLEQVFAPLFVQLGPEGRRRAVKMGDGSQAFCRKAYNAMRENSDLMPRTVDVEEMGRDLATHDALAARLARLGRLMERGGDTDIALGSDVMVAALDGYVYLKRAGRVDGLHGLGRELGKRFGNNGPRRTEPMPETA